MAETDPGTSGEGKHHSRRIRPVEHRRNRGPELVIYMQGLVRRFCLQHESRMGHHGCRTNAPVSGRRLKNLLIRMDRTIIVNNIFKKI